MRIRFNHTYFLICISFLLWIFLFREFLSGKLWLTFDARPYYDHIKYWVMNISRGTFPLWNPIENCGVPNEFFLRRIGETNPFYFIIVVLYLLKVPYTIAHLIFLATYYFIGMIGFYLLSRRIFDDTQTAFVAFCLLLFSSLGTRLFDSYILLIFVPMIWFFYFLISFTQRQDKSFFWGMTFCLMILVTTYLPFYFLTIIVSFLVCFSILYLRDMENILRRYLKFIKDHKILALVCVVLLILSILPGLMFYLEGQTGELVLHARHSNAPTKNIMGMDIDLINRGGIPLPTIIKNLFSDLHAFKLGMFYIPLFAFITLLLGIFSPVRKRLILLFVWGFGLLLIGLTNASPLHRYLYHSIPFFKYFRNPSHFLWISILPIAILISAEQFKSFFYYKPQNKTQRLFSLIFLSAVHLGLAMFLSRQKNIISSSYVVILLSFLIFSLKCLGLFDPDGKKRPQKVWIVSLPLLILIAIQPIEVYSFLNKNTRNGPIPYKYDSVDLNFLYQRNESSFGLLDPYLNVSRFHTFIYEIKCRLCKDFILDKFIIYDHVEVVDDDKISQGKISFAMETHLQRVFVAKDSMNPDDKRNLKSPFPQAEVISENSDEFQVLQYDANTIQFKTNYDTMKFLLYADNFYTGWHASLNNKEVDILRANMTFKGLWLPPGENIVVFRFGNPWQYVFRYALMGLFLMTLGILLFWNVRDRWGFDRS